MNEVDSGTQTTALGVEQVLYNTTDLSTYVLTLGLADLALGDTVIVRVYVEPIAAAGIQLAFTQTFVGVQEVPVFQSIPVPSFHEVTFTVELTTGAACDVDWSIGSLT